MKQMLNVYALPMLVDPLEMKGDTVVIIDVLRASTTIVYALEAGAKEIIACQEVEEARSIAEQHSPGEVLLGGERGGRPIEGFDLGNSPTEYTPSRVTGQTVIFTTTNGTKAMAICHEAEQIYIGAFVNATAVCDRLIGKDRIHLLCAGTNGLMGEDDLLLAGLLVEQLQQRGGMICRLNAQAQTARETWLHSFALPMSLGAEPINPEHLANRLRRSPGGKNVVALGLEDDLLACSQIDHFSCVPEVDPTSLKIRFS